MTDLTVREACKHGRYEDHPMPDAVPTAYLGMVGQAFSESDICSEWREIKLRQREDMYHRIVWVEMTDG